MSFVESHSETVNIIGYPRLHLLYVFPVWCWDFRDPFRSHDAYGPARSICYEGKVFTRISRSPFGLQSTCRWGARGAGRSESDGNLNRLGGSQYGAGDDIARIRCRTLPFLIQLDTAATEDTVGFG